MAQRPYQDDTVALSPRTDLLERGARGRVCTDCAAGRARKRPWPVGRVVFACFIALSTLAVLIFFMIAAEGARHRYTGPFR